MPWTMFSADFGRVVPCWVGALFLDLQLLERSSLP